MTDEAYPNHHARMPPDFYLWMSDGEPVHWGGPTRECHVIDRPRWAGGRMAWRVRVVPPIPEWQRSGHQLAEWVLQERYVGQSIEELRDDNWVTVNLWRYEDPQARSKEVFDDMDLSLAYVGEVAYVQTSCQTDRITQRIGSGRSPGSVVSSRPTAIPGSQSPTLTKTGGSTSWWETYGGTMLAGPARVSVRFQAWTTQRTWTSWTGGPGT